MTTHTITTTARRSILTLGTLATVALATPGAMAHATATAPHPQMPRSIPVPQVTHRVGHAPQNEHWRGYTPQGQGWHGKAALGGPRWTGNTPLALGIR